MNARLKADSPWHAYLLVNWFHDLSVEDFNYQKI